MRKAFIAMAGLTICLCLFPLSAAADPGPELGVSPAKPNFGEVELGETSFLTITISNIGTWPLYVESVKIISGNSEFAIMPGGPVFPLSLPVQNGTPHWVDIEVGFRPSSLGLQKASLEIVSSDFDSPVTIVTLAGTGIDSQGPPTIEDILAFFDAGVDAGTIEGRGQRPGQKRAHLKIFKFKLIMAAIFLEHGWDKGACKLLERSYAFSDDQNGPRDLIEGSAVLELNNMILELMTDLGCL